MKHQHHKFTKAGKYSNKELLALLLKWEQKNGESPSRRSWDLDASTPSSGIYRVRFGSWGKALKTVGLTVKKPIISSKCAEKRDAAKRGKRSCNWKGGRVIDRRTGYVHLWKPEHINSFKTSRKSYSKGNLGYVLEHRFVMSEYLKRPLLKTEQVHHKNGNRSDNRIENLELWTTSHPSGQSVTEVLKWALDFIKLYNT